VPDLFSKENYLINFKRTETYD